MSALKSGLYVTLFSLFAILGAHSTLSAQLDSLVNELANCDADTTCLRIRIEISSELLFSDPSRALKYATDSKDQALALTDSTSAAEAYNHLGIISALRAQHITAIENFQEALKWFEAVGDDKGVTSILNNIGVMYGLLENHSESIKHYQESYERNLIIPDFEGAALNLHNIASEYLEIEDLKLGKLYIDSVISFQEEHGEIITSEGLLGEYFLQKKMFAQAEEHFAQARIKFSEDEDEQQLLNVLLGLAETYNQLGEFPRSLLLLNEVEKSALANQMSEELLSSLELRSKVYDNQNKHELAFLTQSNYIALKDSLDSANNFNRVSELNARYESEKREKELAEKEALLTAQRAESDFKTRVWFIVTFFIVLILGVVSFGLIRNRKTNRILNNQNEEITEQRQKIISSINYAKKIQSSILLPEESIQQHLPESFIYLRPKDIVSGDFYWFDQVDDQIMIATVDCTGHGVPGAFMSLIANAKLNKVVNELGYRDPGTILNKVHEEILNSLNHHVQKKTTHDGMDMSLCVIDNTSKKIRYAGARNPITVIQNGAAQEHKVDNLSIGGSFFDNLHQKSSGFSTREIDFSPGSFLFMYTDGFMDQFGGENNKKLNKARFKELLISVSARNMNHAKSAFDKALTKWRGENNQVDDILIIGARL
ncbi:MAG: serine phosphatase RsbU (regulator of sigma subunit) [Flavobacteriales bacterium]|jgi:serine phosphatase RsbU (regulator of sigma subunit)